jgi:protocatechuate 3,4-dioxygenase beta subunit
LKQLCPVSLALLLFVGARPLAALQAPATRAPVKPAPSPTPAPVLEGMVKGPDGKPVEGALVFARARTGSPEPPLTTQTDAAGRFRLSVRRPVSHLVRVEAKGLAGASIDKARPSTPLSIALTRGTVLEGTVRDGTTGQPVPAARVEARDETALTLPWEPLAGVASANTDAKGRFHLEGLTAGPQAVTARAAGVGNGNKSGALPGRPADVYLFPGAVLSGTVWGPGDLRVAGAVVRAEPDAPGAGSRAPSSTVSDAQGRYEIAGLRPGTYRLVARHKDFAPELVGGVTVERSGDVQADLSLEKGTVVVGRLVTGPEQTVSGRVAMQDLDGQSAPPPLRDVMRAEAGADGRFRLEAIPSGAHVIGILAPGFAAKRVDVHVRPGAREVDVGDIELETGLSIRGRVRDRAGPIAGASVYARPNRPMPMRRYESVTEADGGFVIAGLEPGAYRLTAWAAGYSGADKPAEAGAERVEIVLTPGGAIAGSVVDDTGRPVGAFQVKANPVRDEHAQPGVVMFGPRGDTVNGADGRFLVEDLAEGTYVVEASAAGRANAHVAGIKVTAGSTAEAGTIRLTAGGTIRGNVTDSTGQAVPGAVISVHGPGEDYMMPGEAPQGVSDPSGGFEVTGVAAGTVDVTAAHPNYAEGRASGVEVDPTKGPAEAKIVLSQGGRIEGWVRRRDGTGIPSAYVNVIPRSTGARSDPGMQITNAEGGFLVEHLPPGRVSVALMNRSGMGYASSNLTEVDVREGETTPVEVRSREILVSGHVTRAGAPLPAVRLTLRGDRLMMMSFGSGGSEVPAAPTGPQRMTAVTGEDGAYEMIADQAGRVRLLAERVDGKGSFPMRTLELPDVDAYTLDIAFAGVMLAGVVVDRDSERPIPRAMVFAGPLKPEGPVGGSRAETGDDGRFQMDVEPGDYRVGAAAESYGRSEVEVSVGSGGTGDVRLALPRGLTLTGKVVDSQGNGVGGVMVFAEAAGRGGDRLSSGGTDTLPDGSFQIGGLKAMPHSIFVQSSAGVFATRQGVTPGDRDVLLTLRPGGKVVVRVVGPEGQPVEGAWATFASFMGARTDARGVAEMMAPAGTFELRAGKDKLEGSATVTVAERGTTAVEIKLSAATPVSGGR